MNKFFLALTERDSHFVMSQPEIKIQSAASLFDANGKLADESTRQHVKKFLEAFVVWVGRFKD